MLKELLITVSLLASALGPANAGNLSVNSLGPTATPADSRVVTDISGNLLASGSSYVAVGTFTIDDAAIRANTFNLQGFQQFGSSGTIGQFAGVIDHDASMPLAAGDGFVGRGTYAVIGNGSSVADSNQFLVVKGRDVFAADNPLFAGSVNLANATADQILVGQLGEPVQQPDFGTAVPTLRFGYPEPSSALLLLYGLGSMIFVRRRG